MSGAAEIWVWLPWERDGALHPAAHELLHEARGLCRRLDATAVVLSDRNPADAVLADLARWGVAEVRSLGHPLPAHPICPAGRSPLAPAGKAGAPRAFLFADDAAGKVIAPLWAAENDADFVPAVTGITCGGEGGAAPIVASRPILGEQFEAIVTLEPGRPVVATLIRGAVGEPQTPAAIPLVPGSGAPRRRTIESDGAAHREDTRVVPPDPATLDIADAERIVAFGRGAFTPEAFGMVERLAALLGAAVAGTRPAADEGWIPFSRQVGLTGAIVRPKLYVAVGLSGAPYHMVGVKDPEALVAINADPEAPILAAAHLGIVGDLHKVLPELIGKLEAGGSLAEMAAQSAEARP